VGILALELSGLRVTQDRGEVGLEEVSLALMASVEDPAARIKERFN